MDYIKGKVVVITGASSGIGLATAQVLARHGAKLVLGARRVERLQKLAADIEAAGGEAVYLRTDVSRRDDVFALVDKAVSAFGRIDVIANNAAHTKLFALADGKTDEWDVQIDTNIKGVLYGVAAALPKMQAQGGGQIIIVGSILGTKVIKNSTIYSATKYAMRAIAEGIRVECAPVRSTLIMPGAVATEIKSTVNYHLSADVIGNAIAYAINQPPEASVNELTVRHIDQPT
jgi:NADP-dependent 3-hydroxy acid dehydrogenase YdfG